MTRSKLTLAPAFVVVIATALAIAGCNHDSSTTTTAAPNAPTPAAGAPSGTPSNLKSTRLANGPAPLNYYLGPGGNVRIVDTATGKAIATTAVPVQGVIAVDDVKGVTVSGNVIKAGPLSPGHRYEIWLDQK